MSENTTRRRFLLAVGAATAAGTLPLVTAGTAHAQGEPLVLTPSDPQAMIPEVSDYWYAEGVSREPLNGSVGCGAA